MRLVCRYDIAKDRSGAVLLRLVSNDLSRDQQQIKHWGMICHG